MSWLDALGADPLPWLLDDACPPVRHLALRDLLDRPTDDPGRIAARASAMAARPITAILAAQQPEGWWTAPGSGYLPKYRATTWQLSFLDQLGADGHDPHIRAGCEYLLGHAQASSGAFGIRMNGLAPPAPSSAVHCLNGNLLRALIDFGWLDDARVQRSIAWQAGAIVGGGATRFYASVPGPGFRCGANAGRPCAWGATKALLGLAQIPVEQRTAAVRAAIDDGVAFLLSRDPAVADYPTALPGARPSGSWFKLGFPSGYVADVLQVLEALVGAGAAADPRLEHAVAWLLTRQVAPGRWANEYAYAGKMIVDVDVQGRPSRWVTLRACRVLKAVAEAR